MTQTFKWWIGMNGDIPDVFRSSLTFKPGEPWGQYDRVKGPHDTEEAARAAQAQDEQRAPLRKLY